MRRPLLIPALTLAALTLAACGGTGAGESSGTGSDGGSDGRPRVVAAFYPLGYAAQQVGGDAVDVSVLTPPGVEPHDLELTAAQVAQIAEADLVLYVKGFQPAVDEAVQQQAADRALDVSAGLSLLAGEEHAGETAEEHADHGATDPHVWLDPANMAAIGASVGTAITDLGVADPATIEAGTAAFSEQMDALDGEFAAALATCRSRDLVVSHEAFGYLADAYDLTQVGIAGLSPEAEPSPARLKDVADLVRANGVTTVYYETLVDPGVAETIAAETGAQTAVLDPLEGLSEGATGDYASIMRDNLATLVAGQACT